jgi:Holliday junction resolvase-like predicted endonuclease
MSTHAKLSPSTAHRWLHCTASVAFVDKIRAEGRISEDKGSVFADEGTEAHSWAAKALEHLDAGLDFDWSKIPDQIMAAHIRAYYDLVVSKITGDGQLLIEQRLPLFYSLKDSGTADAIVLTDECLFIIDLKYGQGVSVDAKDNDQLAIYAESFIRQHKLRERAPSQFDVRCIIFQPRSREGEPIREWATSFGEIDKLATSAGAIAHQINNQDDDHVKRVMFAPSDKTCRFCPAKALCTARAYQTVGDVATEFGDVLAGVADEPAMQDASTLCDETVARIAKVALDGSFVKWINSVAEYALAQRLEGNLAGHGLKAVHGNARRQWTNEEAAAKLLRGKLSIEDVQPRGMVSPAQAEKLLKGVETSTRFDNLFAGLITKPVGEPKLALADDPREEIKKLSASSEFSDVANATGDDLL